MIQAARIWFICSDCDEVISIGLGDFTSLTTLDGYKNHHCPKLEKDVIFHYSLGEVKDEKDTAGFNPLGDVLVSNVATKTS